MSESAYEQKDLTMIMSEPNRNPYIEMGLNAKAYFEAYRSLCRLRIGYASLREQHAWPPVPWAPHEECKKRADFWARVGEYWKKKLEESFQREKDYMEGK